MRALALLLLTLLLLPLSAATTVTMPVPAVVDGCDPTVLTAHVEVDSSPATSGSVSLLIAGNVYETVAVDSNGDATFTVYVPSLVGTNTWMAALYKGTTSVHPALSAAEDVLVDRISNLLPLAQRVYAPLTGQTIEFETACLYSHARSVEVEGDHASVGTATDNEDGTATVEVEPLLGDVDDTITFTVTITDLVHGGIRVVELPVLIHRKPDGTEDDFDAFKNTPLEVDPADGLLDNDVGDDIYVDSVTQPDHGEVSYSAAGGFTYTPDTNYTGVDTFTYHLTDSFGFDAGSITVTITVSEVGG